MGISLFPYEFLFNVIRENKNTYNRPRPLDPSAIVRLSLSFLMCIATCYSRQPHHMITGNSHTYETHLPQICGRLCFLLAESTDTLALCDGQDTGCVPWGMQMPLAASGVA
jgi:hypothetical protein